ncbi:MAG TPA: PLDc N-terminal domain-containing protein [Tepidisphaeraceae bacterium]
MYLGYGIGGLLVLILDIYVILQIVSSGGDPIMKLVWIIIVLALPLIGALLYLLLGGGGGRTTV